MKKRTSHPWAMARMRIQAKSYAACGPAQHEPSNLTILGYPGSGKTAVEMTRLLAQIRWSKAK
jgi:hypothetical protein